MIAYLIGFADATTMSFAADEPPQVYVREEWVTTIGVKGTEQREFNTRRDITVCQVTLEDGVFVSDEHSVVHHGIHDDAGQWLAKTDGHLLHAERRFSMGEGEISSFPKSGKVGFNTELPRVSFEYFYFPMLAGKTKAVHSTVDRVAILSTGDVFAPRFDGTWMYKTRSTDRGFHIEGPYLLESDDQHFTIAGRLDHLVTLEPLRVLRLSGKAISRVNPATQWFGPGPLSAGALETVRHFDEMLSDFTFRMLPIDSDEAKSISIPPVLLPFAEVKD
jgi:hypothetical protein